MTSLRIIWIVGRWAMPTEVCEGPAPSQISSTSLSDYNVANYSRLLQKYPFMIIKNHIQVV